MVGGYMNDRQSWRSGLALGGLTAAVALLVGLSQAQAQGVAPAPPLQGAGSFPGSFLVPGTNTSLHVGGVIEFDARYSMDDLGSASPGGYDNAYPNSVGLHGPGVTNSATQMQHGVLRFTDQFTRPNFETRTPTEYGEVKTYWEIDFSGSASISNSGAVGGNGGFAPSGPSQTPCCSNFSLARLKQAYGTLGPWLVGQTNSNFADLDALPDVIDAAGMAGGYVFPGIRYQPQIRYTYLLPNGMSVAGSIEQYESAGLFSPAATGAGVVAWNNFDLPGMSQRFPGFTTTARIDQPWGHVAFHIGIAQERMQNLSSGAAAGLLGPSLPVGQHIARWGYMLALTGHINTIGRDKITYDVDYGQGAAQFNGALSHVETQWEEGLICSATSAAPSSSYTCSQPRVMGGEIGYSHWWNDTWRSGIEFGYDQESRPSSTDDWTAANLDTGVEHHHESAHVNILWTPVPPVQFGLEYHFYRRDVWSGAHGFNHAIAGQALFKF